LIATASFAVVMLTMEVALHHAAHSHAGNGVARQPAVDVLPGDFWRILDRVRGGWENAGSGFSLNGERLWLPELRS
jgi:hypothetical protein